LSVVVLMDTSGDNCDMMWNLASHKRWMRVWRHAETDYDMDGLMKVILW